MEKQVIMAANKTQEAVNSMFKYILDSFLGCLLASLVTIPIARILLWEGSWLFAFQISLTISMTLFIIDIMKKFVVDKLVAEIKSLFSPK
ncbi:hypothetical protein ACFL13_00645 [Patescibacteria group bacterium]